MVTDGRRGGRRGPRRAASALLVVPLVWLATACGGAGEGPTAGGAGRVTVAAAASLRGAFEQLGDELESEQGIEVTFSFDSSSSLATQVIEGAPAGVFASADPQDMDRVRADGLLDDAEVFARNRLTIVTAPENPHGVESLADLADVGIVSLCGEDVPCGRYAQRALDDAGVVIPEDRISRGQNATATLTAVAEGDAVAGIVYVSDASAAGAAVDAVAVPSGDVTATYVIGVLDRAEDAAAARAFVDLVLSESGQAALQDHGFLPAS